MASDGTLSAQLDWRSLNRELKKVDDALYKDMRRWVVEGIDRSGVIGEVQGAFPHRTGRSASTIRAVATARGGAIRGGGARAPGLPWVEYGGNIRQRSNPRHVAHREYVRAGRYITPRALARREAVVQSIAEVVSAELSRI